MEKLSYSIYAPLKFVMSCVAAIPMLIYASSSTAGTISGNHWFLGIDNTQVGREGGEENDTVWEALSRTDAWKKTPKSRYKLADNVGGKKIAEHVKYFHDRVQPGDTFLFYYGGHAGVKLDEDKDDPTQYDEAIGKKDDLISDDELAADDLFGSFKKSSAVVVILNTCGAGGFIGGKKDLDRDAIDKKDGMLFMGTAKEGELCDNQEARKFPSLLFSALEQADENKDGQVHLGEWAKKTKEFWDRKAEPGVKERNLVLWDDLSTEHDRTVEVSPVPLPGGLGMLAASCLALAWPRRRRKTKGE